MAVERISPASKDYIELIFHWHRYLAVSKICENKRVLDIACGEGYGTNYLSSVARECIGIDIDETTISNIKKIYPISKFICGSATHIPCKTNYFDVVISFETIEHLDEDDQKKFLEEIKRVLKKEGVLVISTPDRDRTKFFKEKNPFHKKEFTKQEFLNFLGNYFKNIKLYFQEVNLVSYIFSGDNELFTNYNIQITEENSSPVNSHLNIHLYLIAVCSDQELSPVLDLNSVCQDINRVYLNQLWKNIETLENEKNKLFNELNKIYNSRGWKVLEKYYAIMHRLKKMIKGGVQ